MNIFALACLVLQCMLAFCQVQNQLWVCKCHMTAAEVYTRQMMREEIIIYTFASLCRFKHDSLTHTTSLNWTLLCYSKCFCVFSLYQRLKNCGFLHQPKSAWSTIFDWLYQDTMRNVDRSARPAKARLDIWGAIGGRTSVEKKITWLNEIQASMPPTIGTGTLVQVLSSSAYYSCFNDKAQTSCGKLCLWVADSLGFYVAEPWICIAMI